MALMEYAVVLLNERCKVDLTANNCEQQPKPKLITSTSNTQDDKHAKVVQPWEVQHCSSMNKIDYISLVVFPIFFIAFNIIYFSVHA